MTTYSLAIGEQLQTGEPTAEEVRQDVITAGIAVESREHRTISVLRQRVAAVIGEEPELTAAQRRHGAGVAAGMNRISARRRKDLFGLEDVISGPELAKRGGQ